MTTPDRDQGMFGITATPRTRPPETPPVSVPPEPEAEPNLTPSQLERKPLFQRVVGNLATRIALITLAATGVGYAGIKIAENVSVSQTESAAPFDISKLDKQPQELVLGQNVRDITPEERQALMGTPLPELNASPKTKEDFSSITVLPSIDLLKAGKVETLRRTSDVRVEGQTFPIPINLNFTVENYGTPLGLFTFEGMHADTVEIFKTSGYSFIEKFKIGDNEFILLDISGNINSTDTIKDASYVSDSNFINDILKTSNKIISTDDKSALFTTIGTREKSLIAIRAIYLKGTEGKAQILSLPVKDGSLLNSSPSSSSR